MSIKKNNILVFGDTKPGSIRDEINNYVINNGGSGIKPIDADNSIERPKWEVVKDVLNGDKPISDLRCN